MNARPQSWRATALSYRSVVAERARRLLGWECSDCGLVVGGPPIVAPPSSCPVCAHRRGEAPKFEARFGDATRPDGGADER